MEVFHREISNQQGFVWLVGSGFVVVFKKMEELSGKEVERRNEKQKPRNKVYKIQGF